MRAMREDPMAPGRGRTSEATNDIVGVKEVETMTGTPEATLRWFRHMGDRGPRSFKLGRRVVYKRADVEAWIEEQYQTEMKKGA